MTDRVNSLTVFLTEDIREDDCEALILAIRMLKGVGDVRMNVADHAAAMAEWRAKHDLKQRILRVFEGE